MTCLLRFEDNSGYLLLEDGTGFLALEFCKDDQPPSGGKVTRYDHYTPALLARKEAEAKLAKARRDKIQNEKNLKAQREELARIRYEDYEAESQLEKDIEENNRNLLLIIQQMQMMQAIIDFYRQDEEDIKILLMTMGQYLN